MKVNLDESVKNQITMEVEVPFEEMDSWLTKAAQKVGRKVNIPGFRKGKVPRAILENYIGIDALLQEAADLMIPQVYWDIIEEHSIEPVDQPQLEILKLENKEPVSFKAVVTIKPEVVLGEYKGVAVDRIVRKVTDKDIEDEIERMRQRAAKIEEVADAVVENGDFISLDFEGFIDGVAFPGGKAEGYSLEVGSGSFIPGFEEQLVGMKKEEEKEISVKFPADYHQADFADKDAIFKVKINEVRRKKLPELNDEFVKDISETCDTVADLQKDVREKLEERSKKRSDDVAKNTAINKAVAGCKVEIPQVMIDQRAEQLIEDLKMNLERQGLTIEKYMEYAKLSADNIKENFQPQAQNGVKYDLVMEAISDKEDLYPSGEEINEQIEMIASAYFQDAEKVREQLIRSGRLEMLIYSLRLMKAAQFIYDNAVVTDVDEKEAKAKEEKVEENTTKKTTRKTTKKSKGETAEKEVVAEEIEKPAKKTSRKSTKKKEEKVEENTEA